MTLAHPAILALAMAMVSGWLWFERSAQAQEALPDTLIFAAMPGNPLNQVGVPLIRDVYAELGIRIQVREVPPARARAMLRDQQVDGVIARPAGLNRQIPNAVPIEVPLTQLQLVAFARNDGVTGLRQGGHYRLGLLRGVTSGLDALPVEPILTNTTEQLMELLARNRIDVAVDSDLVGAYFIQRNGLKDLRIVSAPLKIVPVYHYLESRHRALVPRVRKVLERLSQNGELAARHAAFAQQLKLEDITLPVAEQLTPADLKIERHVWMGPLPTLGRRPALTP
ncbi:substrate-binding periplasmic protein [Marinobacter sp. R17]|uniref:substrate-binding periplasmic protein n=1 Tax=Marinobacter sp. R17 TaxID=2484250 RepID=UPI001680B416|nr:transporter substrate-binding domain-containing protein [Marinobacter sp. R17]